MIAFLKKYKYFLLLAVLFIFLRLPSLFEPYWYGDEGIYLVLGQAINKGLVLYRQIHDNKPPTLYYLAAFSQTVFGFRLLLVLWMIPTIYFFYKLSKNKFSTLLFLILTSIPLAEGTIANAEIFMLLPTILGVLLALNSQLFWSGLLLGLAFTIKVPVMFEAIFLGVWFIFFAKKSITEIFKFCLGFIIPIGIYAIYFLIKGAFPQFLFSALLQNFGYLSSWKTGTHSGSATESGLVTRAIFWLLSYLIIWYMYRKKFIKKEIAFILFWFAATIFGALLSSRPYPHYLIQLIPPFCLIIQNIKKNYLLIFPIIFMAFFINKYNFYFYKNISYYKNFYLNHNNYSYFNGNIESIYKTAKYIKSKTAPVDKIFVWGDEPYIYAYAARLPVGRYTVAYHISDFNGYSETMQALKANPPKTIVYYPQNNRPFDELDAFINRYYLLVQSFSPALIFELNQ